MLHDASFDYQYVIVDNWLKTGFFDPVSARYGAIGVDNYLVASWQLAAKKYWFPLNG